MMYLLDQAQKLAQGHAEARKGPAPSDLTLQISQLADKLRHDECAGDSLRMHNAPTGSHDCILRGISFIVDVLVDIPQTRIKADIVQALEDLSGRNSLQIGRQLSQKLWGSATSIKGYPEKAREKQQYMKVDLKSLSKDLLHGLYFEGIDKRESDIEAPHDSTFRWMFDHAQCQHTNSQLWPDFQDWLKNKSCSTYWIAGKPGSGKSVMMKYIATHDATRTLLKTQAGSSLLLVLKYYAWKRAPRGLQKSIAGLKRTLLYQAISLQPELIPWIAPRRYAFAHILQQPDPSIYPPWESWEIDESFSYLFAHREPKAKLAIFIDGLDELEDPVTQVTSLVESMTGTLRSFGNLGVLRSGDQSIVTEHSMQPIKICISGRPWTRFEDTLRKGLVLEMHVRTRDDIQNFVQGSFKDNNGFKEMKAANPEKIDQITSEIVSSARGVFRWVKPIVDSTLTKFSAGNSFDTILHSLADFVYEDMNTTYEDIWNTLDLEERGKASWLFQLLRAAAEPLPWLVMYMADEYDSQTIKRDETSKLTDSSITEAWLKSLKRRLATRTRGLLEIAPEVDGYVDFTHHTAQQWAYQAAVWSRICKAQTSKFEMKPYAILLAAGTRVFRLSSFSTVIEFQTSLCRLLWYASLVENSNGLDDHLNELHRNAIRHQLLLQLDDKADQPISDALITKSLNIAIISDEIRGFQANFLGLAVYFSIFPFVEARLNGPKPRQAEKRMFSRTKDEDFSQVGLLFGAIFGPRYALPDLMDNVPRSPIVSLDSRQRTVKAIVEKKGKFLKTYHSVENLAFVTIMAELKLVRDRSDTPEDEKVFYGHIEALLNRKKLFTRLYEKIRA